MKIGSSLPIISNPGRQPGQSLTSERPASVSQQSGQPQRHAEPVSPHERIASTEQTTSSRESRFFNMDRDLSYRGQEALNAYLITESYQPLAEGELVGVDLYI